MPSRKQKLIDKQNELDVKKWLESETAGYDLCGEFEFCVKCIKTLENPCSAAYDAFYNPPVIKKPPVKEKAAAEKKPRAKKEKPAPTIAAKPDKPAGDKPHGTTTRKKSPTEPAAAEEVAATVTTRRKSKI